jgi:methionyl-tRNA formyltransferase
MSSLRIVFFGTPEFAVPSLRALLDGPDSVVGVVCQPDKPAGRGQRLVAPPVKQLAQERQVTVLQPAKLRPPEPLAALERLRPDLIVVAAYGKIFPPALLALPHHGCINVHASLLPKYRGAAPIQWAILRGETITGITIMQMNEGMDTGDVLLQRQTTIDDRETYGELQLRLAELGAAALLEALERLKRGELRPQPQDDRAATMAPMIDKEDGRLDWRRPAVELARVVRAFNPWPSAFTTIDGVLLKIHRARALDARTDSPGTVLRADETILVGCGEGALQLDELQMAGRKRLPAADFLRGVRLQPGTRLGAT